MNYLQGMKLVAVLAVALSMGACANKNPLDANGAIGGAATPGSQQDFVVNVGDRVFFESDQTDLSPQATATHDKQAQWLQTYNRYSFTIEGHADERGTRPLVIMYGHSMAGAALCALWAVAVHLPSLRVASSPTLERGALSRIRAVASAPATLLSLPSPSSCDLPAHVAPGCTRVPKGDPLMGVPSTVMASW